jgi:hypothetical protein
MYFISIKLFFQQIRNNALYIYVHINQIHETHSVNGHHLLWDIVTDRNTFYYTNFTLLTFLARYDTLSARYDTLLARCNTLLARYDTLLARCIRFMHATIRFFQATIRTLPYVYCTLRYSSCMLRFSHAYCMVWNVYWWYSLSLSLSLSHERISNMSDFTLHVKHFVIEWFIYYCKTRKRVKCTVLWLHKIHRKSHPRGDLY